MKGKHCWFIILFFNLTLSFVLNGALIKGVVLDNKKNIPLQGVNILVEGTKRGSFTNLDGQFYIEHIQPGSYKIIVSMVGYEKNERNIVIKGDDDVVELKIYLKEKPLVADQVVVTANRREETILNSNIAISVYEPDITSSRNIVSMEKAINYVGGVTMNREQVSIRNSSGYAYGTGSRVLLLIDGIPLLAGDTGEIKWDAVPTTNIKRIEVVKQPGSALYGSNALGGVINIVTSEPDGPPSTTISAKIGFYEKPYFKEWQWTNKLQYFQALELSHSRRIEKLGFIFNIDEKTNKGYRQNEDYERFHSFFKTIYHLNDTKKLFFGYNTAYEEHGSFTMWRSSQHPFEPDPDAIGNRVWSFKGNGYISYERKNFIKGSFSSVKFNTYYNRWNDNFSDEVNKSGNWSRSLTNGLYLQHNPRAYKLVERENILTFGSDLYYSTTKSKIFKEHFSYGISLFAQDELNLLKYLNLTIGVRTDIHKVDSNTGWQTINPKFGLVYKFADKLSLRLSCGRGYRVPTIAELFTQTMTSGLKIEPNPKLNPESVWNYEFGGSYFGNKIYLNISFFRNEYYNMIEALPDSFDRNGNVIVRFKNYTRARIEGLELESKTNISKATITFDYTLTNPKDLKTDSILPYRPEHIVKISGEIEPLRNFTIGSDYIYKSRLKRVLLYTNDPRVEAHILDLRAAVKISRFNINLVCSNLLHYYYTDIERNINAPRNWSIGVKTGF